MSGKLIKSVALPFSDKAVITWNGMDYAGKAVPAGIYVCRITGGRYKLSMKVLCVR
ncbi:MAG: hypothetical protein JNL74_11065 [Fibrobacteres bacterium]|nr:hypothetical protein [Fibrobacterota bacterium]